MKTINHECYISLEVAKLLREAGFDWECDYHYADNTLCHGFCNNDPMFKIIISAPTLDVAQRWLREVKSFMVETTFITDEYSVIYQANLYEVVPEKCTGRVSELVSVVKGQSEFKKTYEEALEAGTKKALELILEKGE